MRIRYTRELLATTAAGVSSIDEMLNALGKEPETYNRRYLRSRLNFHGVDTSHFRARGAVYTKELLEEAVAACHSIAGVVRYLGQRSSGGTQQHVGRRIKAFGIDTSHFTGQAHNRGRRSGRRLRPEQVLVQRPADAKRLPGVRIRQALLETGLPDECSGCGTGPVWHGKPMTLEVDHINGDWSDNRPDNVRLLCPNCHATTDTYCGRNKNRRSARTD
ncbi:HNH endonuclease signature motif containing protein [Kitasatospora sp. NPDC085895]|uniref:HNH endonuclease signature motif containing protein n=1 Tax=Kitasatospora sp. NPDC085895 TaxID=3155057 RepID=UPI00344C17C3